MGMEVSGRKEAAPGDESGAGRGVGQATESGVPSGA